MPSEVPRNNTAKKREQLLRREQELKHALHTGFSREKLIKAVEGFRAAHLSLLKAELYWTQDASMQRRDVDEQRLTKIKADTRSWMERSADEILDDYAA